MKKIFHTVIFLYIFFPLFGYSTESLQYTDSCVTSQGPRNAPITIVQYSDFQCPVCAQAVPVVKQIKESYPGLVHWVFKNYPLPFHNDAHLFHEAAMAAGEQGKFWEMHDLLFNRQNELKRSYLLEYARDLNLNIDKFSASLDSGRYITYVDNDIAEGNVLGVRGAPTFFVNGKKLEGLRSFIAFKAAIDEALIIASSIEREPGEKPLPLEQVAVNIASSPFRGATDSPITIIEFSDFQSPLSAKTATVIDNVMERYSGKVKYIYKHHPQIVTSSHEAAIAAEEQGKFWKMHDLIFSNHGAIDDMDYILYATQLGLDMDRFMTDLNNGRHHERILQDKALGELLGVKETPTIFVNGKKLVGAQLSTRLDAIIEEELERLVQIKDILGKTHKRFSDTARVGPPDAPVQIMIFSDFQSPDAARTALVLKGLHMAYGDQILLQFKHYSLDLNPETHLTYEAVLAAGEQGKFWEMYYQIFSNPGKLEEGQLIKYAKEINLDLEPFKDALEERTYQAQLQKDIIQGIQLDVRNVPTLFINGIRIEGTLSMERLESLIDAELKREILCQG